MAVIPLRELPNAPDLASMSRPQTNDLTVPKVDLSNEAKSVARSYGAAEENVRSAGLVGASVAEVGQGVYKGAKTLADKQQELNDNAAWAEFSTNYDLQKAQLDDSLQQAPPSTWASSYANFRAKNIDPAWQALPVSVQQKRYGEYLKLTSEDQIKVSHAAFQKNVADSTAKSLTDINLQIQKNDFPSALKKLEELHASNGIGGREYEAQKSLIQTSEQSHLIDIETAKDPVAVKRMVEDAMLKDEQLPGFPNIGKDQLPKIATKAQKVFEVQQDRNYGDISSAIASGGIKSVADLEKDPRFSRVADEKNREALKESITDRWLYTKEGEAFTKVAMNTVKAYPQTDNPATEAMQLRKYVNEQVPSIYRDAINKELDSKINEMASNGGRLKPETELVQYGTQRLNVARDGSVFGKFYPEKEVKEDSSGKKAKANIEILKQMEDVELQLRNSGAKTRADVDRVIEEATAAGRAKKAAGEIGNQKGWFDFLKSRKKDEPITPAGKVTKYGYEKPGDADYDSNSARGIGAADNKLVPGESVALSPDLEKSTGAKIGDKLAITIIDKDGNPQRLVKTFDDRTMQDKQAIKRFGSPLRGRVDIYSPDGNQPLDGVKVAKVERYTEDGQG